MAAAKKRKSGNPSTPSRDTSAARRQHRHSTGMTVATRSSNVSRRSQGTWITSQSLFLDDLPNELQQMIYSFALKISGVLVKIPPQRRRTRAKSQLDLNLSLFTVSKQISANARAAFFNANLMGIKSPEHAYYLPDMRQVGLGSDFVDFICTDQFLDPSKLSSLLALPKLQTVLMAVDPPCLRGWSVRSLVGSAAQWEDLRCVEIGSFDLVPKAEWMAELRGHTGSAPPTVRLCLSFLKTLFPEARALATTNSVTQIEEAIIATSQSLEDNASVLEHHGHRLACWLRSYDDLRKLLNHPTDHGLNDTEIELAEALAPEPLLQMERILKSTDSALLDMSICDQIAAEDAPGEFLELITNLLNLHLWL